MMVQSRKINVMQVIGDLDIGGAQEVVRTLVDYLSSEDCQPIVGTFKDGPMRQDIERLGVPVETLPARRYPVVALPLFVADMIQIWRGLAELVDKYDLDVIQTHLLRSLDFLTLLLPYTTPLRAVVWTFHNSSFELPVTGSWGRRWSVRLKNYSHRLLYRLSARMVSGFVGVSDKVGDAMVEILGPLRGKITVICNGVDVKRYERAVDRATLRGQLGLEAGACLIAVVATLKEQKGHRYLVEAMASIVPQHPEVHVLVIGDGGLRAPLEAQVELLGLGEHIHFLGNRDDVPTLLAGSDLFVLPSLWEGLPMALLEAMAAGLPIVATEVSGTVQVMISNETGILVPPGNTQRLAEAIEQLLAEPAQAQAMGAAARRLVSEKFSARKQAAEHVALYRRLL